jgi:Tfp pilus assembly protein PilV
MIRTFSVRLRVLGRSLIGVTAPSLRADAGDTLLEVIVSALLLGIIVVGLFSGLNSTNAATSINRARSQADALAEQNEEQLHSLPISTLKQLEEKAVTKAVEQGGTKFEVTSSATYYPASSTSSSCTSSSAAEVGYIQTASTVTWHSLGKGKPVVETGIVSPPPDTSLIVEVTNELAEPVAGMEAQVTGPTSASALTSTSGCAILAVSPGEYAINVHRTGYVDQNWFPETKEDSFYEKTVYLPAETTTKKQYLFAPAAQLKPLTFKYLNPTNGKEEEDKALNATLENTEMSPTTRLVEKEGNATYLATMQTAKIIYPFHKRSYTLYAGSCVANKPPVEEKEQTTEAFPPELETGLKLILPSLIVDVWKGSEAETKTKPELVKEKPKIFLSDTDKGCEETYHEPETIEPTKKEVGALKYPGQPWGTYTVCVNVPFENKTTKKIENKHFEQTGQKNNNPKKEGTVVNLYEGGPEGKELKAESCP